MFCKKCGHECSPGARFCASCGTPITWRSEPTESQPPISVPTVGLGSNPVVPNVGLGSNPVMPNIESVSKPVSNMVTEGRKHTGSATAFLSNNAFKIVIGLLAVIVIAVFLAACIGAFERISVKLSGLDAFAAGLGMAVYMVCFIVPASLLLLVALAIVTSIRKTFDPLIRAAYFPAAGLLFSCLVIVVGSIVFRDHTVGDMAIAFSLALESYIIPAAIGAVSCVVLFVLIRLANGRVRADLG